MRSTDLLLLPRNKGVIELKTTVLMRYNKAIAVFAQQAGLERDMPQQASSEMEEGDDVLAQRCAAGDAAAYARLVDRHLPKILALTRRMIGDDAEAEDMAQEAMLKLWRNAGKFDAERAKLSTWLYRIASNLCIDRLRKKKFSPLEDAPEQEIEAGQVSSILQGQLARRMDVALQELPERQRLALVLFHYQELSLNEAAENLDCSVDAFESLLRRARQGLKKELEGEWRSFMPDPVT